MARVISDNCVGCGVCESVCPAGAVSMGETHFEIDPDACIDCGVCEMGCPEEAISED